MVMRYMLVLVLGLILMGSVALAGAADLWVLEVTPQMQVADGAADGPTHGMGQNNIGGGNTDTWGMNVDRVIQDVGKALEKVGAVGGAFNRGSAIAGAIGAALDMIGGAARGGGDRDRTNGGPSDHHNDR